MPSVSSIFISYFEIQTTYIIMNINVFFLTAGVYPEDRKFTPIEEETVDMLLTTNTKMIDIITFVSQIYGE